jgi:ATP-dependent helicase HrpB
VRQSLPIDALLADIVAALRDGNRLVLRAPPGAGKTTRVPAALLDAGIAGDRQVLVLEPRRIAARAAAEFVAAERGGAPGGEVGYRVRFERRGGTATRLWFLTEGVLGRQLASDPFVDGASVIVLDEFHERHLQGDVALAVVRELQETVRPDLKLVVMSATLATEALAAYLPGASVLTSEGRARAPNACSRCSARSTQPAHSPTPAVRCWRSRRRPVSPGCCSRRGAASARRTARCSPRSRRSATSAWSRAPSQATR